MKRENKFREVYGKGMERENKFREFPYFSSLQPRKYLPRKFLPLRYFLRPWLYFQFKKMEIITIFQTLSYIR